MTKEKYDCYFIKQRDGRLLKFSYDRAFIKIALNIFVSWRSVMKELMFFAKISAVILFYAH